MSMRTSVSYHIYSDCIDLKIAVPVTFIILERSKNSVATGATVPVNLTQGMVGDVNLFMTDAPEDEDEQPMERTNSGSEVRKQGELEIMIAETAARRKGYASQALKLLICYAMKHLYLGPEDFLVRIGMSNLKSIQMFEKMGLEIVKKVEVFQEVEMRVRSRTEQFKWLMESEKSTGTELSIA